MSGQRYTWRQWIVIALSLMGICALPFVLLTTLGWRGKPARPVCALVDVERALLSEGTDFVFMVPHAGTYRFEVRLAEHCTSTATARIGPLRTALRPDPVYEPDEPEHTLQFRADKPVFAWLELAESGAYILRIEPIPMAMGTEGTPTSAHVKILAP